MNVEVFCFDAVAPVRERGLKCAEFGNDPRQLRRSREGAWIEIQSAEATARAKSQSLP